MQFAVTRKHSRKGTVELVRTLDVATMEAAAAELNLSPEHLQQCIGVNDVHFRRGIVGDGSWLYYVAIIDKATPIVA